MSSIASVASRAAGDGLSWYAELLGAPLPAEGHSVTVRGRTLAMLDGILRAQELVSTAQNQTSETFGFKWAKRDTFEGAPLGFATQWLVERYGEVAEAPYLFSTSDRPILLDAGCGAAGSALALFNSVLGRMRYLGVDVSTAVD